MWNLAAIKGKRMDGINTDELCNTCKFLQLELDSHEAPWCLLDVDVTDFRELPWVEFTGYHCRFYKRREEKTK